VFLSKKARLSSSLHHFFKEALDYFDPVVFKLLISVEPLQLNLKYVRGCKNVTNLLKQKLFEEIRYLCTCVFKNKVLLLIYSENNSSSVFVEKYKIKYPRI
jgi:hypothetical protein